MRSNPFQKRNVTPALLERTDEELLLGFLAGHTDASFDELVERHEDMVWAVCWQVLHQQQDTEDASQRTFLVLWQKAETIRNTAASKSWLHGVTSRVSKNVQKSRNRRESHECSCESDVLAQLAQLAQLASDSEFYETQALILAEVERLPEGCRFPFVLCCMESKSKGEVAQQLGLPEGSVASRVRQARKHLRRRLGQLGVTPPSKS